MPLVCQSRDVTHPLEDLAEHDAVKSAQVSVLSVIERIRQAESICDDGLTHDEPEVGSLGLDYGLIQTEHGSLRALVTEEEQLRIVREPIHEQIQSGFSWEEDLDSGRRGEINR